LLRADFSEVFGPDLLSDMVFKATTTLDAGATVYCHRTQNGAAYQPSRLLRRTNPSATIWRRCGRLRRDVAAAEPRDERDLAAPLASHRIASCAACAAALSPDHFSDCPPAAAPRLNLVVEYRGECLRGHKQSLASGRARSGAMRSLPVAAEHRRFAGRGLTLLVELPRLARPPRPRSLHAKCDS
jgi:hypothetical protein